MIPMDLHIGAQGQSEVLLAWYSLIQHLLLDDSTPDDESTYDVITRLRRSEEGSLDLRNVQSTINHSNAKPPIGCGLYKPISTNSG